MSENTRETISPLPDVTGIERPSAPWIYTRLAWSLWVGSLGVLGLFLVRGSGWGVPGVVTVDGLTVLLWVVATLFSGIVHSYSKRYMAGDSDVEQFFRNVFAFTAVVVVVVAADHLALFVAAWLAMGLVMAQLIGHVRGWAQARAAASLARRYFVGSTILLGVAFLVFWQATGATTISGVVTDPTGLSRPVLLVGAGALVLAAMVQSALVPFHTWLLSSMTAPTPASALMHAGFVNAGGILLARFAPVVSVDPVVVVGIVLVGAASAILGKLLKSVQANVKGQLGCSTVGQMGFMIMQAGLGFFGAAITHLVLHGFYKAYLFLSSGSRVEHTSPTGDATSDGSPGVVGAVVAVVTALASGVIFVFLTGKGASLDGGLVLTVLVVVTTMHATLLAVRRASLSRAVRYGAVPALALPAITIYAGAYNAITYLMADLPLVTAPTDVGLVTGLVVAGFLLAYVAIETGTYKHSRRLYVALVNATQPPTATLTTTEEYNEY